MCKDFADDTYGCGRLPELIDGLAELQVRSSIPALPHRLQLPELRRRTPLAVLQNSHHPAALWSARSISSGVRNDPKGEPSHVHGNTEADRELGKGVMSAEAPRADQRTLVRRELAAAVTLTGDDEQGDPLDQGMRQVERGRIGN